MQGLAWLVTVLAMLALPGVTAALEPTRVVDIRYDRTDFLPTLPGIPVCERAGHFCFATQPGETHARAWVIDDVDLPGPSAITGWTYAYGTSQLSYGTFCGEAFQALGGAHTFDVYVFDNLGAGSCDQGCPPDDEWCPFTRNPIEGTVRVQFLRTVR